MNSTPLSEEAEKPEDLELNFIQKESEDMPKRQISAYSSGNSSVADIYSVCVANNWAFGSSDMMPPYYTSNKAIFTILIPSSKILVVNSAACELLNYNSEELCSMKLEYIIHESYRSKLYSLQENFILNSNEVPLDKTKLVELIQKDGGIVLVHLYLQKIDNPLRCLAVAEPMEQNKIFISVDENGKILSCDEEVVLSFYYDASDLIGVNIHTLLPAICLSQGIDNHCRISKQKLTGRTKNGDIFPVYVTIDHGSLSSEVYQILIWVPLGVNGQIFLSKELSITNLTCCTKVLFGFSKKDVINRPITYLIPKFCKDVRFEKTKRGQCRNGISSTNQDFSLSSCLDNSASDRNSLDVEDSLREDSVTDEKSSASSFSPSKNRLKPSQRFESTHPNRKSEPGDNPCLKTLFKYRSEEKIERSGSTNVPVTDLRNKIFYEENSSTSFKEVGTSQFGRESKKGLKSSNEDFLVQEGKFLGRGRHCDGAYIDIIYQVKMSALSDDVFYCVWLSGDLKKLAHVWRGLNTNGTVTSSFNSSSFESSLPKDNNSSGQYTRPSSASMISQCDEYLTAGDYSKYYTNIRQIGKGAFGYVKLAFRNSDGLLVVTKFIKKQKINVRCWVFHPDLNMKIPLEVSFLTALNHPNIVKVLDVFHNDSFVQLVMEKHGAGFDLFEFIDRRPNCDEKLKSYIFRQITSAVHYLNSLGILHRDIKDENVIINEKFEVKLIDFGSATFMPPEKTFSGFYGTVDYCSPEVLQGNTYKGPELEIWALGVTLYVLTFGENPFYDVLETIKGEFSIPSPISKELNDLLHSMLDKNVKTRITINKLIKNVWINQPVDIRNYRFTDVVRCYEEEAFPPKYVYDICSDEIHSKRVLITSNGIVADFREISENELSAIEDDFKKMSGSDELQTRKQNNPFAPTLLSSTPLHKSKGRLCKSAVDLRKRLENSTQLIDDSLELCKSDLIGRNPRMFNLKPESLIKRRGVENLGSHSFESVSNEDESSQLELEVRFKRTSFYGERKFCWKKSSKQENVSSGSHNIKREELGGKKRVTKHSKTHSE